MVFWGARFWGLDLEFKVVAGLGTNYIQTHGGDMQTNLSRCIKQGNQLPDWFVRGKLLGKKIGQIMLSCVCAILR